MKILNLLKRAIRYTKKNGIKKSLNRFLEKLCIKLFHKVDTSFDREEQESFMSWIKENEPNKEELEIQRKTKFEYEPKISIIVPMYNTKERYFKELVESVINQTYSNWELCLADGSIEKLDFVYDIIQNESRIKYKILDENKGISGNSNAAIELATGDYLALLDHDDIIPEFSLFEIVKAINEDKEAQFIYTDEDKLMEYKENRLGPHFKPDYAPDTLRSYNYICHFSIFKKNLMDKLGGFNSEFDGSQDYDLIIRATEQANRIIHIQKLLYNWRMNENSVALNSEAKPYAYEAAKRVIKASLKRQNIDAEVMDSKVKGLYRVKYKVKGNPKVSIIIPNKDHIKDLKKCLESIQKSTYDNYEILIIENNSEDNSTFKYYHELISNNKIKVLVYETKEFNYSKINNFAVQNASGEYILLLNNDIEILTEDYIEEMLGTCQRNDVGAVGAKLIYKDNKIQHAGVVLGLTGIAGHVNALMGNDDIGYMGRIMIQQNFNAVTGAMLMVSKENYLKVGMLSEEFAVAYNDIDFCLKLRDINKVNVYNPYVEAIHYESKTRGYEDTDEKKQRLEKESNRLKEKWPKYFEKEDAYFNINFRHDIPRMRVRADKI